jgi:hypothetical protein
VISTSPGFIFDLLDSWKDEIGTVIPPRGEELSHVLLEAMVTEGLADAVYHLLGDPALVLRR